MVSPEWSPDEGYNAKLERLAYALVRTNPQKEQCESSRRNKNVWLEKCKGLAGPFALTLLVAIPYIAENSSGTIIVAALLLAAVDAALAVWCYTDFETQHGHCCGDLFSCMFSYIGEFPAFLVGWWWICAMASGFSACARTLSSIMDSVTGRHVETLLENTIGSFTPFGAPIDIISFGVITVPSIMCSLGMEDSYIIRGALFALTSTTTLSIFLYALISHHFFPAAVESIPATNPEVDLYSKIVSGGALACVGFLSLYTVSKPDNLTLTQHKHFNVTKRFSLTGTIVASTAFLVYLIEAGVINKVQQTPSVWDGDPPLLWPLQGWWRLIVAGLGITALSFTTFEFLMPLCIQVTRMANVGLLYRNFRKKCSSEEGKQRWSPTTPLLFGGICAMKAMLLDTKILLSLVSSSLMCINILVAASMIAARYQVKPITSAVRRRSGHIQTRPSASPRHCSDTTAGEENSVPGSDGLGIGRSSWMVEGSSGNRRSRTPRRMITVTFMHKGAGKVPTNQPLLNTTQRSFDSSADEADQTYLVQHEVDRYSGQTIRRESVVSGYESDTEQDHSDGADDTDVDAVVTEYQEHVRVATLSGTMPMFPTPETCRRVCLSITALVPCCVAVAAALNNNSGPKGRFTSIMLGVSSGLLTFLLLVVISRQPQRRQTSTVTYVSRVPSQNSQNQQRSQQPNRNENSSQNPPTKEVVEEFPGPLFFEYTVTPWVPAAAMILHCSLLLQGLDLAATPFAFWLAIGLIIYFSYSVTKSVAAPDLTFPPECIHLGSRRQSCASAVVCGNDPSAATTSTSTSDPCQPPPVVLA